MISSLPATAVGKDFLGDEMLRRFRYWELSPEFASRVDKLTGAVVVDLDDAGVASYKFLDDVAWDHIPLTDGLTDVWPSDVRVGSGRGFQRRARTPGSTPPTFQVDLRTPAQGHDKSA